MEVLIILIIFGLYIFNFRINSCKSSILSILLASACLRLIALYLFDGVSISWEQSQICHRESPFFCGVFAAVMVPMVSRVRILAPIGPDSGVIWSRKAPIGPDFTIPVPETSRILSFLAMK